MQTQRDLQKIWAKTYARALAAIDRGGSDAARAQRWLNANGAQGHRAWRAEASVARREAVRAQERKENIAYYHRMCGGRARSFDDFETPTEVHQAHLDVMRGWARSCIETNGRPVRLVDGGERVTRTIVLAGPVGVGKSHLAYSVLREIAKTTKGWHADAVTEWLAAVGSAMGGDRKARDTAARRRERMRDARFLLLDDMGSQAGYDWQLEEMFRVVDHRNVSGLVTLITTNAGTWEALAGNKAKDKMQASRIASRLSEDGLVLRIGDGWKDYRRRNVGK